MQSSKYNLFVPNFPKPGKALVYNTLSQALVVVDESLYRALEEGRLESIPEDAIGVLLQQGLISDSQEDAFNVLERIQENAVKAGFELTVLTTLECNFACPYCFEGQRKKAVSMNKRVASALLNWLEGWIRERGYQKLFVVFYGGEPLLNKPIIDYIIAEIERRNIADRVYYCLITNGSLLDEKDVVRWVENGLVEVRVTLDGPREVHDKRRPFRGGMGSYDVVVKNLERILGKVGISITVNFDETTESDVRRLIDELAERGWAKKIKSLLIGPIVPEVGMRGSRLAGEWTVRLFSSHGLFRRLVDLIEYARIKGFNMRIPLGMNTCPLLMKDGGAFVDPEGYLYKCASFVGEEGFRMGSVFEGWDREVLERFGKIRPWRACPSDCKFLPLCQGGCRLFAHVLEKDLSEPFCQKEFFEQNLPELLKKEYLWRVSSRN